MVSLVSFGDDPSIRLFENPELDSDAALTSATRSQQMVGDRWGNPPLAGNCSRVYSCIAPEHRRCPGCLLLLHGDEVPAPVPGTNAHLAQATPTHQFEGLIMEAIAPKVVLTLFGIPITDTVVSTWVMMVLILVVAIIIRKYKPEAAEMIIEMINGIVSSVMPEDANLMQYLPLLGALTIFLLLGNIFSIFPGMVSPTANINTTFALAVVVFFAVHVYGIREKGLGGYLKDIVNPIFIFPLEIVSQLSRTLSLTLRLFGNILSTDLVVAIVFSLIPYILPIPLAALGMLTGVLQAYIFTVLASLYIASAVEIESTEKERRKLKQELQESS